MALKSWSTSSGEEEPGNKISNEGEEGEVCGEASTDWGGGTEGDTGEEEGWKKERWS